jgi:hypothetical protein
LKQTNNQSFIHPLTLLTSWIWNFGFYWDWIDAQANNFLAPFLPKQQLSFSLSLFQTTLQDRLEEEWRMRMNNEMAT